MHYLSISAHLGNPTAPQGAVPPTLGTTALNSEIKNSISLYRSWPVMCGNSVACSKGFQF
jgi:hypothetical protein